MDAVEVADDKGGCSCPGYGDGDDVGNGLGREGGEAEVEHSKRRAFGEEEGKSGGGGVGKPIVAGVEVFGGVALAEVEG